MKLVNYTADGKDLYGAVVDGGIVNLSVRLGAKYPDIKSLIAVNALGEAAKAAAGQKPDHKLDAITYRPVIHNPDKIICVGLNYKSHREETGRAPTRRKAGGSSLPACRTEAPEPTRTMPSAVRMMPCGALSESAAPITTPGMEPSRMLPASVKSMLPLTQWAMPAAQSRTAAWKTSVPTTFFGERR